MAVKLLIGRKESVNGAILGYDAKQGCHTEYSAMSKLSLVHFMRVTIQVSGARTSFLLV